MFIWGKTLLYAQILVTSSLENPKLTPLIPNRLIELALRQTHNFSSIPWLRDSNCGEDSAWDSGQVGHSPAFLGISLYRHT